MIVKKIALFLVYVSCVVYGIEYIPAPHKNMQLKKHKHLVVYVYKTSMCPHVERIFKQLEQEQGTISTFAIIRADVATQLFDAQCTQFPTILFIRDGIIKNILTGKPSMDVVKRYIIQL